MRITLYSALLILIATLASCNHKDLCYMDMHKSKIIVKYDWRDAPDANPKGMCVFFYSMDNDTYYRFDFDNTDGGEVELPAGSYRVVTYNNDTELTRFSGTNYYDSHTAYTREGDLLEPLYGNGITSTTTTDNGERVCIAPDALWGCHVEEVEITEHGIAYTYYDDYEDYADYDATKCISCAKQTDGDQVITLYPHDMLCHYSYEVRNVKNAENISRISASLSGMAATMNVWDETLGTEDITIPVSGKANADNHKVTGQFLTFGQNGGENLQHKMTFFVVMNDGTKYRIENYDNLDVTSQVDNAPDRRHVHIIIDGLDIPDSQISDDGWNPTVDDWGVHEEDLKI